MAGFSFGDSYKLAGLAPGPEIIHLRHEPFEKLRRTIDPARAVELTRLYFGLPLPDGTDWFRDAFAETDPSFSMLDNEREAAVLAECLLRAALDDAKFFAALAPLTAAAGDNRSPAVRPEFLDEARQALHQASVDARHRTLLEPLQAAPSTKSTIAKAATELEAGGDWPKAADLFKRVSQEASQGTANLTLQVRTVLDPLVGEMGALREEVEMLWWYLGGWSRIVERPFSELQLAVAAVLAGLDLADLTNGHIGPAAAPAILQRVISVDRVPESKKKVTIKAAVDAFRGTIPDGVARNPSLSKIPDICPVLTAFMKARELGASPLWHSPYKRMALMAANASFQPLELALQAYREVLLLKAFQ